MLMDNSEQNKLIIFSSVFLLGNCNQSRIIEFLRSVSDRETIYIKSTAIPVTLSQLKKQGWLFLDSIRMYSCTDRLTYPVLKKIVSTKTFQAMLQECKTDLPFSKYSYRIEEDLDNLYTRCCAAELISGNCGELDRIVKVYRACKTSSDGYFGRTSRKDIISSALIYLDHFPEFEEDRAKLPPELILKLLPYHILQSLIKGKPLPKDWRKQLEDLPAKKQDEELPHFLVCAYLENDRELFKYLMDRCSSDNQALAEALHCLIQGEWKMADRQFTRYLNGLDSWSNTGDPHMMLALLLAFFSAAGCTPPRSRIERWLEYISKSSSQEEMRKIYRGLLLLITEDKPRLESKFLSLSPEIPLTYVLQIPVCVWAPKMTISRNDIETGLKIADNYLSANLIPPGIYLLNAAGSLLEENDPRRQKIIEITAKYRIVPLVGLTRKQEAWEYFLTKLENIVSSEPKKKDPATSLNGSVVWQLTACPVKFQNGCSAQRLQKIQPVYFARLKRGGYAQGKPVSCRRLLSGFLDSCLNPDELRIKDFISEDVYYSVRKEIGCSALNCLHKSKVVLNDDWEHYYTPVPESNSLISSRAPDGTTSLTLKYLPTNDYAYGPCHEIYLDTSEPGICRYFQTSDKDPLLAFFLDSKIENGIIRIPAGGTQKLNVLAEKIAESIPVTGVLAEASYRNLPKIEGKIELHVQLRRGQGNFRFDFRNRPHADSELLVKPGSGFQQKHISGSAGDFILIRDLQQETTAFQGLLAACPSLPGTARSDYYCELDEPEEILNALSELKAADCQMDWLSTAPLKITKPLTTGELRLTAASAMDWFQVGGELQIDPETLLPLQQLLEALEHRVGNYIPLDNDSYLLLTKDLLRQLEALKTAGTVKNRKLNISPAALPMLSTVFDRGLPENLAGQIERMKAAFARDNPLPVNLNGTLRAYQEEGFRYLARLADCRIGCCLADDMGLGKTIQLLTLLLREAPNGPALVVCPASLCRNWEREAQKFAPTLHTVILPQNGRREIIGQAGKGTLLLCSYGILQSEIELFSSKEWHVVILDEAQAIKNHLAKRSRSSKALSADIRIASTGTPVENHLLELWSIFDFLNPGLLGPAAAFEQRFCINNLPRPELKKLVSPLILRRRKSDVLDDLPDKTEITLPLDLPPEERAQYEVLRLRAISELQGQEQSHVAILAQLSKLRRFCCDPSLVWPEQPAAGAKLQRLAELAEELKAGGNRALIFSQYVDFLQIIRKKFDQMNFTCQYLDGSTPQSQRMQAVDDFQNGSGDFFLISLKAGGVGLNLTAANYVILADPWWNPAVEDQAADRIHRIGQTRSVTIYRLIVSGTVEERIMELHRHKRQASEDILENSGNAAITAEELMALFKAE